jgi:hypothetical protein
LGDRSAHRADQHAPLIEIVGLRPGPDAPHLDSGMQVRVTAAEAPEKKFQVILRVGVLALQEPWPQALPDVAVAVTADLIEIISSPPRGVLGDREATS